jgi:DNA-binding NtrC family response regulator
MERLLSYSWPGNIRELQSVLKQALLQATGSVLLPAFLPIDFADAEKIQAPMTVPRYRPGISLSDLEREAIQQCLIATGGNRQKSAEQLGISTRTLLRKIREYRLDDPLRQPPPASGEGDSSGD